MPDESLPAVLLLSESESLATLDRRALREAGASGIRLMTSGVEAARMLAGLTRDNSGFQPGIIVCTQKLADMDGEQFCALLRLHPRLLAMPVLLVLPNDTEAEQLRTLGCGASALLGRPYAVAALREQLHILASARQRLDQLQQAARQTDTRAFDEALTTYGILLRPVRQPEDYFRVGMQCLQAGRWNNAINAFQRALRSAQIKGEAELGMAVAWKGKGDITRFRTWLARAADTFVLARRWHRARSTYARLLQEDPSARNPFLSHARQLIRDGKVDEAAEMLAQGFEVTPMLQVRDKLAQTCLAADEPKAMLAALEASLERIMGAEGNSLADEIRASLDSFVREQEERRREKAAEQRWRATQTLTQHRQEAAAQGQSDEGAHIIPARTRDMDAETAQRCAITPRQPPAPPEQNKPCPGQNAMPQATEGTEAAQAPKPLAPLSEAEATSELFLGRPKVNELLSVIKLTWKLMRRSGQ